MKEEMRTIGYLCPRCRKPVMQQRSRFALAASGAIVQCECGKSELQIDFDGEKFRISVPCGVCGGEHLAECGADRLLDGEGIGLACPETSELCCFIGEEYAVERALAQLQITAEKQSAQGDAPEAFTDTVIMYEVLSELKEIAAIVDGPISGEVKATTTDAAGMIAEGEAIYALDPAHMVVKIPMTAEGLKAIKALSAKGIPTNCTLIFTANQALLAARAGATYVSPFLGRLDDISQPGIELVQNIHDIFLNYPDITTQIIAASVRNPIHVTDCALAGADIATVPYKVIEQMLHHPLTDAGIEKFKADYVKVFGE